MGFLLFSFFLFSINPLSIQFHASLIFDPIPVLLIFDIWTSTWKGFRCLFSPSYSPLLEGYLKSLNLHEAFFDYATFILTTLTNNTVFLHSNLYFDWHYFILFFNFCIDECFVFPIKTLSFQGKETYEIFLYSNHKLDMYHQLATAA